VAFDVAVSTPKVSCLQWLAVLENSLPALKVPAIRLSDIVLSADTSADASIHGTVDVRKYMKTLVPEGKFSVRSTAFVSATLRGVLFDDGRACIEGECSQQTTNLLRAALLEAEKPTSGH
jgi:hypothetical protein